MRAGIRTLQRVRELREQQALGRVAEATRAVRAHEATVAEHRRRHEGRALAPAAAGPAGLRTAVLGLQASHEVVEAAVEDLAVARHGHEGARSAHLQARRSRRSLDRLVERQADRDREEARAAEQRAADEMALLGRRAGEA